MVGTSDGYCTTDTKIIIIYIQYKVKYKEFIVKILFLLQYTIFLIFSFTDIWRVTILIFNVVLSIML